MPRAASPSASSVRRQLEEPETLVARAVQLPLRMLYIVSRPADTGFIDPRLTTKALFAALDPLGGNVRLDFCRPPTAGAHGGNAARSARLAGDPYDLVHFDGHGTFLPEAQIGALCFEKPDDGSGESETDLVRADRLGDLAGEIPNPARRAGSLPQRAPWARPPSSVRLRRG